MFLIKLIRYFLGYLTIRIEGDFPEKLLNIFMLKKVSVWDIKKSKNAIILKIPISYFRRMREFRGKTRLKVKIVNKHGIFFIFRKYFKRIGIPVGISVFLLTIYSLSLFIWNVDVVGNQAVPTGKILSKCEDLGVKNGAKIKNINSQLLREKLILSCDGISWCSFNIEGSKITVNISEISRNNDENSPSNIISDFDGIITEIMVESGVAFVKKGQAVQKGDILISGVVQDDKNTKFVRSSGVVKARIFETIYAEGDFSGEKLSQTGEIRKKRVLEFFTLRIPLFLGEINKAYDEKLIIKNLSFLGKKMPIRLFEKSFILKQKEQFLFTREELLKKLNREVEEKLNDLSVNFEISNRNISELENKLRVTYDVRYDKIIGVEEKIIFDIPN